MEHQDDDLRSARREIHRAADRPCALMRRLPVGEVAVGRDLVSAEHDLVDVPAARHRERRGRLVRLVVPVLELGLERSVNLAESMDARGFGRGRPGPRQVVSGWLGLAGVIGLCGAMVALVGRASAVALLCLLAGSALLVAALVLAGSDERVTRYRVRSLTGTDLGVLAVVAVAPIGLALCRALDDESLRWVVGLSPAVPEFRLLPAALLLLLAAPGARDRAPPRHRPRRGRGMTAVRWDDVGFAWPDGPVALDGVHLEAPAGDVLLVVGDSGSGKSTLLRTVNGLVPHGSGGRFRGEVVVGGRRTRDRRPRRWPTSSASSTRTPRPSSWSTTSSTTSPSRSRTSAPTR